MSFLGSIIILLFLAGGEVSAGTIENAQEYYKIYGNNAVFIPTTRTNGYIYCATRGNRSEAKVKYKNIGWRMTLRDTKGNRLLTLYFKLGGNYLTKTDSRTRDGYEYDLYTISLFTLKQRLNTKAQKAMEKGECSLLLDACMVVSRNGIPGGSMDDEGKIKGTVYTSYKSIADAADWSDSGRTALKTYFGKQVVGLFFDVIAKRGTGIKKVTGGGRYCYGTYVKLEAVADKNYIFDRWEKGGEFSSKRNTKPKNSFFVEENSIWTAYAKTKEIALYFYRNSSAGDKEYIRKTFIYPGEGVGFPEVSWGKSGYHIIGWDENPKAISPRYPLNYAPSPAWISSHYPRVNLYAVWAPYQYKLSFAGYLVNPIRDLTVSYENTVILPENGGFEGWTLNPEKVVPDYKAKERIKVSELVHELGIENVSGGIIILYALWDSLPSIEAEDMYYSLEYAQAGMITEQELAVHGAAYDKRDGKIKYGQNDKNTFIIKNYRREAFTELKKACELEILFEAVNSMGNRTERTVVVHITDSRIWNQQEAFGKIRFISKKYINEKAGGLSENSCWKKLDSYWSVLNKALSY